MYDATRYVSFTFDDGLIAGARKAADLLEEVGARGTFYIVTGWIRPRRVPWIRDPFNRGHDHGSWDDWREIAARGHEIGAHTFSHLNARGRLASRLPAMLSWEMRRAAADIERRIRARAVSCSMPWNASTPAVVHEARRWYSAMRVGGPRSTGDNAAPPTDWHGLESWAPDSGVPMRELVGAVDRLPPGHWLIFQFHSLDGEGYMPLVRERLRELLVHTSGQPTTRIVSIAEMVRRFAGAAAVHGAPGERCVAS